MPALHTLSALELLAAYAQKTLSPVEVTQAVLAQIERREQQLHATYAFDPAAALAMAQASETRWRKGEPQGALDGVPPSRKTSPPAACRCRWARPPPSWCRPSAMRRRPHGCARPAR